MRDTLFTQISQRLASLHCDSSLGTKALKYVRWFWPLHVNPVLE
jgi:hypothetical protein